MQSGLPGRQISNDERRSEKITLQWNRGFCVLSKTCMYAKLLMPVILLVVLTACTSAGAPAPGERAEQIFCGAGTLKVCMGFVGSRILEEQPTCGCY